MVSIQRRIEAYIPTSSHPLQTLSLSISSDLPTALWVVYIHGGAWRDPTQTKETGYLLLDWLAEHKKDINTASIDYRLSLHPVDPPISQTIVHPGHILDVISAIEYLTAAYDMKRYIIIGHSAGATLGFQALMGRDYWEHDGGCNMLCSIPSPMATVGLEGIYDLALLAEEYPDYIEFIQGAFGKSRDAWIRSSPAYMDLKRILLGEKSHSYEKGKEEISDDEERKRGIRVLLVHSSEDELLSSKQAERMRDVLLGQLSATGIKVTNDRVTLVKVKGKHDEVPSSEETLNVILRFLYSN